MESRIISKALIGAAVIAVAAIGSGHGAMSQTPLKVIVFPGMSNLPQIAAEAQGYYKKRGLQVQLINKGINHTRRIVRCNVLI